MSAVATQHRPMQRLFDPDGARTIKPAPSVVGVDRDAPAQTPARRDASGGGPMLDDLIAGVWEGLATDRAVACPVCGGAMRAERGGHAIAVRGRCGECGSTLW